jgi:hypothetical protein
VQQRLHLMLEIQFTEMTTKVETEKMQVPHRHNIPLLHGLIGKVSQFALDKLLEQLGYTTESECTGQFTSVYGLPCVHILHKYQQDGRALTLNMIHYQWWLTMVLPGATAAPTIVTLESPRSKTLRRVTETFATLSRGASELLATRLEQALMVPVPEVLEPALPPAYKRVNKGTKHILSQFEHVKKQV